MAGTSTSVWWPGCRVEGPGILSFILWKGLVFSTDGSARIRGLFTFPVNGYQGRGLNLTIHHHLTLS